MKRIMIWDMDFYHKVSFMQNVIAMKLSSYHQQLGDTINFVLEEDDLKFSADIIYIIKENKRTPFPPSKYVDNKRVKLIGKEFHFYSNQWEIDLVISMVRPDYNLYPMEDRNKYANAHMIQLLHKVTFLPTKQNYINSVAKHHQKSIVVDEHLWKAKKEVIKKCLNELKGLKNIMFLNPISLKKVVQDKEIGELFLALHFSKGTIFKFRNDYGSEFDEVKEIIDFLYEFKEKNTAGLQGFPVKAVLYDHWKDRDYGIMDLERCLRITDYAKEKKIQVLLKTPRERLATPYWVFFDIMQNWTTFSPRISYVDAMLKTATKKNKLYWYQVLNDPLKWNTPRTMFLLHVLTQYPEVVRDYGVRRWGDEQINLGLVKLETIVKSRYYFEADDILLQLQAALQEEKE